MAAGEEQNLIDARKLLLSSRAILSGLVVWPVTNLPERA